MVDRGGRDGRQLPFAMAIVAALAATLAITGGSGDTGAAAAGGSGPAGQTSRLDPRQLAKLSVELTPSVARRVERIRGLEFDRLPKPEVVGSAYLNRLALREVRGQPGGLGAGDDDAVGRITGLLSPDDRLEAAYRATGDLAAAAYDSQSKRLYIVRDAVVPNRAMIEFVLAHELDHALEDQSFGLREGAGANDDRALAQEAQVEGSATAVMIEYAAAHLNPLSLLAATSGVDDGTAGVPKAFVDQLTWAYLGGNRFIGALVRLAGGWKLVDYALQSRSPASTEQVLHPAKYVRDERPLPVRVDPGQLRARGWRPADRGVFGELPTDYLLRVGAEPALARRAAAGWGGDRYELWRDGTAPRDCVDACRSDLVLVILWRWDTAEDRRQFERAARDYVEAGLGGEPTGPATWALGETSVALGSGPRATSLAFAPGPRTAAAVASGQPGVRPGRIRP